MEVWLNSVHMTTYLMVAQKPECTDVQMECTVDMSESVSPRPNGGIYNCVRFRSKVQVRTIPHSFICKKERIM